MCADIRQSALTLPRLCLSLCVEGKLEIGRPFRTCKVVMSESIRMLIPSMPDSEPHSYWTGCAKCKVTWENMIDDLGRKTHRKYDSNNNDNSARARSHNSEPTPPPSPPQQQRSNRDESTPFTYPKTTTIT